MRITISGDAIKAIEGLNKKVSEIKKPIQEATLYQERETKLNFLKESTPDGDPWTPLAPSTLLRKRTSAKLRETSTLINSVASAASGSSGKVFASTQYGAFHQTGTSKMPAREFLGISDKNAERIEQLFTDHFGL